MVNNDVPVKSVKELIDLAKAQARHAQLRLDRQRLLEPPLDGAVPPDDRRPSMIHVPYKGSAPMVTDLLGGHVQVAFDNVPNVITQVKAGKLRALAHHRA